MQRLNQMKVQHSHCSKALFSRHWQEAIDADQIEEVAGGRNQFHGN